ncbi:MAG: disulfide bond formation protein B [Thermogemmata sp.]|uniref:Disulfide bond formation protein B n=1 Tax=Thermogemmata fonticola TaxID=2755323 RepID=A0A7V9AAE5_9BACT|nr:disulfide bond formation protein B [Thermogemmata fonticola]MBA2225021.1 disulfide bond formation protein B [Thermogemmata fonticola]MCX8140631.1 disulfide bond formation protein B [Gemmataceae bacterium]
MVYALLALLASMAAVAGSLYLSLGMDLQACTLCFYQRALALALVGVLLPGVLALRDRGGRLCLAALPVAIGGWGVALFHVWLGWTYWPRSQAAWYLACPEGIYGLGTAPQQSLAIFTLIMMFLLIGGLREVRKTHQEHATLLLAVILGAGIAAGCLLANPKMPDPKPLPPGKLSTCQPTPRSAS